MPIPFLGIADSRRQRKGTRGCTKASSGGVISPQQGILQSPLF